MHPTGFSLPVTAVLVNGQLMTEGGERRGGGREEWRQSRVGEGRAGCDESVCPCLLSSVLHVHCVRTHY